MMVSLDEWRRAPPSMEATILTIEAITFLILYIVQILTSLTLSTLRLLI